jgi:hypothetical protein
VVPGDEGEGQEGRRLLDGDSSSAPLEIRSDVILAQLPTYTDKRNVALLLYMRQGSALITGRRSSEPKQRGRTRPCAPELVAPVTRWGMRRYIACTRDDADQQIEVENRRLRVADSQLPSVNGRISGAMKPGDRIKLIKRVAGGLGKLDWGDLDLTLRQFGLPWSEVWNDNDPKAYAVAHIESAEDDKLLELEEYLFPASGPTLGAAERVPGDPGKSIWTKGLFRMFLSHTHAHKTELSELKIALRKVSIDGFVAHEDIEPTKKWETEIGRGLNSCDAIVAYLTPDFKESNWTDQEIGWCVGRGVPILPIRKGCDPYGFVGKYQAISGTGKNATDLAEEIVGLLIEHEDAAPRMASALVNRFAESPSYNAARENLKLIYRIPKRAWTPDLIKAVRDACDTNHELTADWGFGSSTVAAEAKKLMKKVA